MNTKVNKTRGIAGLFAVLSMLFATLIATPAMASTSQETRDVSGIETDLDIYTDAEMNSFLLSSEPKTVHVDITSGQVTKVEEGVDTSEMGTFTTVRSPCVSGDLCARASQSPLRDYGFTGTGSQSGAWTSRNFVQTGNWYARIQWENNAYTGTFGPGTTLIPNRTPATLTGVVMTG